MHARIYIYIYVMYTYTYIYIYMYMCYVSVRSSFTDARDDRLRSVLITHRVEIYTVYGQFS